MFIESILPGRTKPFEKGGNALVIHRNLHFCTRCHCSCLLLMQAEFRGSECRGQPLHALNIHAIRLEVHEDYWNSAMYGGVWLAATDYLVFRIDNE